MGTFTGTGIGAGAGTVLKRPLQQRQTTPPPPPPPSPSSRRAMAGMELLLLRHLGRAGAGDDQPDAAHAQLAHAGHARGDN